MVAHEKVIAAAMARPRHGGAPMKGSRHGGVHELHHTGELLLDLHVEKRAVRHAR
jgi:hypothetical protein